MSKKALSAALTTLNSRISKQVNSLHNRISWPNKDIVTPLQEYVSNLQGDFQHYRNEATKKLFPFGDGFHVQEKTDDSDAKIIRAEEKKTENLADCKNSKKTDKTVGESYILLDYDAVKIDQNNDAETETPKNIAVKTNAKVFEGYFDGYMNTYIEPVIRSVSRVKDILPFVQQTEKPQSKKKTKTKSVSSSIPVLEKDDLLVRTRSLITAVEKAESQDSILNRLEDVAKHLRQYPETNIIAIKHGLLTRVKSLVSRPDNTAVTQQCHLVLSLLGEAPVTRRRAGIRILAIDGGGTRGLISVDILREIERRSGQPIYKLFDYICGVSTGGLIATMIGIFRVTPQQTESIYKQFSREMFERNRILGTGKLVLNHAFYDADIWERILRNHIGEKYMIDTAKNPGSPKMGIVSCLMNGPTLKTYVFRSYNLPPTTPSVHTGSSAYKIWQAIRASSAAPGYFPEFALDGNIHLDGGLHTNNPAAIAIHESKCLWPSRPLQCVVSLGNGRYDPVEDAKGSDTTGLKLKITRLVQSATDTEGVHSCLQDLLPSGTYFRFNPFMSEDFLLDEIKPDKLQKIASDTREYLLLNEVKLDAVTNQLLGAKAYKERLKLFKQSVKNSVKHTSVGAKFGMIKSV